MHPNNPPQESLTGFSRLLVQCTDNHGQEYPTLKHSGCWISKDRQFIIVPDNVHDNHYQLLPISVDAGKAFYRYINKKEGPLLEVLAYYMKHFKNELV